MKKNFCKSTLLCVVFLLTQWSASLKAQEIEKYTSFLSKEHLSPKGYILSLYSNHDLILLYERFHAETTQYEMILDLIGDPDFYNQVSTVYFEIGGAHLTPMVDTFFAKKGLSGNELEMEAIKILREAHWRPLWTKYTFVTLLKGMYKINQTLSNDKKMRLVFCDYPLNWNEIQKTEDFPRNIDKRDSVMASTIIHSFDQITEENPRKKGLAILNYNHAFTNQTWIKGSDTLIPPSSITAGMTIKKHYNDRVCNVLMNTVIYLQEELLIQTGKWDAAFKANKNKPIGFNLKNSPFGKDHFDLAGILTNLKYEDVFTGMVFYKPIEEHILIYGNPNFVTPDFLPEMIRRHEIGRMPSDTSTIKEWYNNEQIDGYGNIKLMQIIIDNLLEETNRFQ